MRISDWSSDVCSSDLWRVMEINPQIVWEHELHPPHRIISSRQLAHAYIFAALRNGGPIDVRRIENAGVRCRSEEHTSELQSLMRISYAVFCLKKKHN